MIDFHTHIFSPDAREHRVQLAQKDPTFSLIYADEKARMIGVEELLQAMQQEGVEASVVCGFPWYHPELCRRENDYLLECSHRYPEGIIPFVSLPADEREAMAELERCVAAGARGVGELAPGTYGEAPWDQEVISSIFAAITEKGLPVLVHVNEPLGHPYPGKGRVGLHQIESLLEAAQGMEIVLAHMGGGFFFYELMPEIAALCRGVYYDTAAAPFIYDKRVYAIAISIIGAQGILFGSDYPLISPSRYAKEMKDAGIAGEDLKSILQLNAQRLLGNP